MKASISSVWFIGLVITFLLIFSAYIIITVDYSATFNFKNDVLDIIEKNKGLTYLKGYTIDSQVSSGAAVWTRIGSLRTINAYLSNETYEAKGTCGKERTTDQWIGVKKLYYSSYSETELSSIFELAKDDTKYYYCVARFSTGLGDAGAAYKEAYKSVYYQVQLFYKFEIPVLKELLPVRVEGTTDEVYSPSANDLLAAYENVELYD